MKIESAPRFDLAEDLLAGSGQVLEMTTILQFIEKAGLAGVFDDHATKVMGKAFDAARKDLHDTGQPDLVYEVIAKRIIGGAKGISDFGQGIFRLKLHQAPQPNLC